MAKLQGIKGLRKALERLETKIVDKVAPQAMRDSLAPMLAEAKDLAPVESAKLKNSIRIRMGKSKRNIIRVSIACTGGHDEPIAAHVEYGTRTTEAHPFLRPAFNHHSDQALSQTVSAIARAIEEAGK